MARQEVRDLFFFPGLMFSAFYETCKWQTSNYNTISLDTVLTVKTVLSFILIGKVFMSVTIYVCHLSSCRTICSAF